MSYDMTMDMSMGFSFWGFSMSAGISTSYASALVVDTSREFTSSVEIEYEIYCTGGEGEENNGVGLWQFVVANGDGTVVTETRHTVCRYGEHYNQSPDCPWNACANGECTECIDGWAE